MHGQVEGTHDDGDVAQPMGEAYLGMGAIRVASDVDDILSDANCLQKAC